MSTTTPESDRDIFCPSCGARHAEGAQFCEHCGHHFTGEEHATQVHSAATEPAPGRSTPWVPIAAALAVLAAAAVVVALVLSGGDDKSSGESAFKQGVATEVAKVTAADNALADELDQLRTGGQPTSALAANLAASTAAHDAQVAIDALSAQASNQSLHAAVDAALAGDAAYLAGVKDALRNPSNATAADLTPLATSARENWAALAVFIPGAGGRVTGYAKAAAWARSTAKRKSSSGSKTKPGTTTQQGSTTSQQGSANTTSNQSVINFTAQVEQVLAYSRPGFDKINQVYGAMKAGTISWDDARIGLDYVLSNRQTALARANALTAPTAASTDVRQRLAAALEASLANDRDILAAFNSYATEDVVSFYNSQALASVSSSAASSAKRSFLSAYNALRASAGLGSTQFDNF